MRILIIVSLVLASVAAPVSAQGFLRQLARTGLTQEDVNIMVDRAYGLYREGNATVGDDIVWHNPETDAHGLAEITEVEGNCVRVAYRFITTRRTTMQTIEIRECLQDGRWVSSG